MVRNCCVVILFSWLHLSSVEGRRGPTAERAKGDAPDAQSEAPTAGEKIGVGLGRFGKATGNFAAGLWKGGRGAARPQDESEGVQTGQEEAPKSAAYGEKAGRGIVVGGKAAGHGLKRLGKGIWKGINKAKKDGGAKDETTAVEPPPVQAVPTESATVSDVAFAEGTTRSNGRDKRHRSSNNGKKKKKKGWRQKMEGAVGKAVDKQAGAALSDATGGAISEVPEGSGMKAMNYARENPENAMAAARFVGKHGKHAKHLKNFM